MCHIVWEIYATKRNSPPGLVLILSLLRKPYRTKRRGVHKQWNADLPCEFSLHINLFQHLRNRGWCKVKCTKFLWYSKLYFDFNLLLGWMKLPLNWVSVSCSLAPWLRSWKVERAAMKIRKQEGPVSVHLNARRDWHNSVPWVVAKLQSFAANFSAPLFMCAHFQFSSSLFDSSTTW